MSSRYQERAKTWRERFGVPVWVILTFWTLYGGVVGNQIMMSMPDHGHSWWRMVGWQVGSAMGWAALTPLILWLGMRFPLEPRLISVAAHSVASLGVAAAHLLPTTLLAIPIDPYSPIADAKPFLDEYAFQVDNWLLLDILVYFGIVALGTGIETKRRQLTEARLSAELARAELRALRLELQPHFLFNALNAVAGLMRRGSAAEAEDMLIRISELLRTTLDSTGRQLVTVAEELRLTEIFLDVQRARYSDRLAVRFEVEPETESVLVPNLLLQPIVENAVRHGVDLRPEGGTIIVSTQRIGDRLRLRVEDDGPGLPADWSEEASIGYGLENVTSRLETVYSGAWELDLRDGPRGGVVVEIVVPIRPGVEPESGASNKCMGASKQAGELLMPRPAMGGVEAV